jgi:Ca-activated chloride channel family protein
MKRNGRSGWFGLALLAGTCVLLPGAAMAKEVACRIELDRAVLPAGAEETAVIKVSLDAPEVPRTGARPPVNLALVLDRSGSMSGDKIERAKEAAVAALRRLGPEDLFSLVIYDHEVETLVPAQSARNTEWIEGRIRSITARGNTALFAGVSQGAAEVRRHLEDRRYVHRIILLSDGLANVGPSSPEDLARLGSGLIKENISVTTVGVGTDYNEDLMTRLSQRSDGNAYFVRTSDDLPRIFAAELGDVLSVVARKVILEITFPEGVRPVRIIGRDGRVGKDRVELQLNQLYGGQQKYVLVEVRVPAAEAGMERELAQAQCRYENALTSAVETALARISARFSDRRDEVVANANKEVQADVGLNLIAVSKNEAVDLADVGKKRDAVETLRRQSEDLRKLGGAYGNAALIEQSAALEKEALDLDAHGMDRSRRKDYRTDSFQTVNQQEQR